MLTVWRSADLPQPRTGMACVPLAEGVSSVLLGSLLHVPVALFTSYAPWNHVITAL